MDLEAVAYVTALAALPEVGPSRLAALLARGAPAATWSAIAGGRLRVDADLAAVCGIAPAAVLARWAVAAGDTDVAELWQRHLDAGIAVLGPGSAGWPVAFEDDPDPPSILFARGHPGGPPAPRVAIVGTRRCTRYGFDVSRRLGHDLAAAGVSVVSGLAAGIDGASHHGALDAVGAPPVGIVATGLDVPYPRGHTRLWERVAERGVLLSEAPLGTRPVEVAVPARNRIIAALSDAVVVVESPESGGSMHTVDEALRRDRLVFAVPGPVTSTASAGTNRLLRDVASPCCEADDVLVALGLPPSGSAAGGRRSSQPTGTDGAVLDALGWTPATVDLLVARTGRSLGSVALALEALAGAGWVVADGPWYERVRQ